MTSTVKRVASHGGQVKNTNDIEVAAASLDGEEPGAAIVCVAPPAAAGTTGGGRGQEVVQVVVALPGLSAESRHAVSALPFAYHRLPLLEALSPTTGSELGGTVVVVRGVGFVNTVGLACRFEPSAGELSAGAHEVPALRLDVVPAR